MPSRIVALWCWYDGSPFRGYQSQPQGPTVQDTVRDALLKAGFEHLPVAAGRTDLGVHARMQVLTLRVAEGMPTETLAERVNAHLPGAVGIALAKDVPKKFHAQWSATGKEYRYRLLLERRSPSLMKPNEIGPAGNRPGWGPYAWRVNVEPARLAPLLEAAQGTHDFWAFHEASSARRPRTLESFTCTELGDGILELKLKGPGFARYMVRYLVGGVVGVLEGKISEHDFMNGLHHGQRFSGIRAPASGLVLWSVTYPAESDPFSESEREEAKGVPQAPPFTTP